MFSRVRCEVYRNHKDNIYRFKEMQIIRLHLNGILVENIF